jgi:hypothetical protein
MLNRLHAVDTDVPVKMFRKEAAKTRNQVESTLTKSRQFRAPPKSALTRLSERSPMTLECFACKSRVNTQRRAESYYSQWRAILNYQNRAWLV